jgi:hypothetical protein
VVIDIKIDNAMGLVETFLVEDFLGDAPPDPCASGKQAHGLSFT